MLKQCCCCSLRTGCFILAYLNIFSIIISVIDLLNKVHSNDPPVSSEALIVLVVNMIVGCAFVWGVHNVSNLRYFYF